MAIKKRKRCQCGNDMIEILIVLILHAICEIKHCVSKCVPVLNDDKIKYHRQEHICFLGNRSCIRAQQSLKHSGRNINYGI